MHFAEKAPDAYWLHRMAAPQRAVGATAANKKRKETGAAKAMEVATAKKARIDGSSNEEVADDRSEELAARVEFASETHVILP